MAKSVVKKKLVVDEVNLAWQAITKKKVKEESKEDKEEITEKTKEEIISEKSNFDFKSILPEKAPSLEMSQNLENAVGFTPARKKEDDGEKEKVSYSPKAEYMLKEREEQRNYVRPTISLSEARFAVPKSFEIRDFRGGHERVFAPKLQGGFEREYITPEDIETKQLEHEKPGRDVMRSIKKYKPAM